MGLAASPAAMMFNTVDRPLGGSSLHAPL
jgi:hypothetical protein